MGLNDNNIEADELGVEIKSDFFSSINTATEQDENKPKPEPAAQPQSDVKDKTDADDLDDEIGKDEAEIVSFICVEGVDFLANLSCQALAGEFSTDAFKANKDGLARIRKAVDKLIAKYMVKVNPVVTLVFLVIIVYAPNFISAFNIRRKKNEIKKAEKEQAARTGFVVETKAGPGRPTKQQQELKKIQDDLDAKLKK